MDPSILVSAYEKALGAQSGDAASSPEAVGRLIFLRNDLHKAWPELTADQRARVSQTDTVLIKAAPSLARLIDAEAVSMVRAIHQVPPARWWFWLDRIADGSFSAKRGGLIPRSLLRG